MFNDNLMKIWLRRSSLKAKKKKKILDPSENSKSVCDLPLGFDSYLKPDKTLLLVYRAA